MLRNEASIDNLRKLIVDAYPPRGHPAQHDKLLFDVITITLPCLHGSGLNVTNFNAKRYNVQPTQVGFGSFQPRLQPPGTLHRTALTKAPHRFG